MKILIYLLMLASAILMVFNSTHIDVTAPFEGESTVAAICVLASACVLVLLATLLVSKKISEKAK
jgi:hypothetical protein